jgi:hypothetical protein
MTSRCGRALVPLLVLVAVVAAVATAMVLSRFSAPVASTARPGSTTRATTGPAAATTRAAEAKKPPRTFVDVVLATAPAFPTTQPIDERLEYRDSAAVVVEDPVYLCPRGDLWITRADADVTAAVLKRAKDEQVHVLRDRVSFVHWRVGKGGDVQPHVVVPADGGGFGLMFPKGHVTPLPDRPYAFSRAFAWNDRIVVPTAHGVSVLTLNADQTIADAYCELLPAADRAGKTEPPVVMLDTRGILAFVPAVGGEPGSRGAFRFVDDHWTELGAKQGWPEEIVHLVPLLDGSVLRIAAATANRVELQVALLDAPQVDANHIGELVANLSNEDEPVRAAAFAELTRYGPSLWPVLDKLMGDQPPEAQIRLQQLLQNRNVPALGGMTVMRNDLRAVQRYPGGGVVFFSDGGVSMPVVNSEKLERYSPAFIAVLPGRTPALVPLRLMGDMNVQTGKLFPYQNTWIVSDDVQGPRMFSGVAFIPLIPKAHRPRFTEFAGQDGAGRLLFREGDGRAMALFRPAPGAIDAAEPTTARSTAGRATLIVDPFLPDPTPRLPVWVFDVPPGGTVGWDKAGYPVVKSGGGFALEAGRFRNVPKTEEVSTKADGDPATTSGPEGTYTATDDALTLKSPDGKTLTWPLPDLARGSIPPHLVRAPDGKLFLYNQAGRIVRIRRTDDATAPFAVDATFTNRIPNLDKPLRIWLDPAGRIVIASDRSVSLLFPNGRIPRETVLVMPVDQLDAQQD